MVVVSLVEWILTAAHCIDRSKFEIKTGLTQLNIPSANAKTYNVDKYIIHPQYRKGHKNNNDIALVKIKGKFNFNNDTQKVKIVSSNENLYSNGQPTKVSGWGRFISSSNDISNQLLMVNVPILSNTDAQNQLGLPLTTNMIATSSVDITRKGACQGDSGGPLTTTNLQGETKLIGVVSWGRGDCSGGATSPTVYTKVANYIDWINQHITIPIKIEGNPVACDHSTQTYIADNPNGDAIHWQISNDIEEINRTENSITIRPKAGFNGLTTIKVSNDATETIKKIWVGKPKVEYNLGYSNTMVNYHLVSKHSDISLEEQGITNILCRDSNDEPFTNSSRCKLGTFSSRDTKWWAERETEVSNVCGVYNFTQLIKAPYISTNPCDNYRISSIQNNIYRLSPLPCIDDDRLQPFSTRSRSVEIDNEENNPITIQIADIRGRILLTTRNKEFSLEHLPLGTYYARVIKNGQLVHTQTLLKN